MECTVSKIRKRLYSYLLGISLSLVIIFILHDNKINNIPLLRQYTWALPFIIGFISISLFFTQFYLIHEGCHHSVFVPTSKRAQIRLTLVIVSLTVSVIPFYLFIDSNVQDFPPEIPYFTFYSAVSGVVAVLITPYLSKLFWEYFGFNLHSRRKIVSGVLIGVLTSFGGLLILGNEYGLTNFSLFELLIAVLTSACVGAGFLISLLRKVPDYENGRAYAGKVEESNTQLNMVFNSIRKSNIMSLVTGFLSGVSLPLLAGVSHAFSVSVNPNSFTVGFLVKMGYGILLFHIISFSVLLIVISTISLTFAYLLLKKV